MFDSMLEIYRASTKNLINQSVDSQSIVNKTSFFVHSFIELGPTTDAVFIITVRFWFIWTDFFECESETKKQQLSQNENGRISIFEMSSIK